MKIFGFMAYFVCKYKKPRIGNKNKNGNIRKLKFPVTLNVTYPISMRKVCLHSVDI